MPELDDNRTGHLGWVECALRRIYPDLPDLRLQAQAHHGSPDIAFIEVYGVEEDRERRRRIRSQAGNLLRRLGYRVELESGRDIHVIRPTRPVSAHDEIEMLQRLRAACDGASERR